MHFLPPDIEKYVEAHTEPEPPLLRELNRETHLRTALPQMISGHLQGRFLTIISRLIRPGRILEIGTFTGYSAICLASGLAPGGELHTIDVNEEYTAIARRYFKKAGLVRRIKLHIGEALTVVPLLRGKFDIVYIDADKVNYPAYFKLALKITRRGGIILADNALWGGKVIHSRQDDDTRGITEFNRMVLKSKAVENLLLPLRDGLMLARVV